MIQFIFSPPPCPSVRFVRVFFFSTFAPLPPTFTESRKMIFSFLSGMRMGYIFLWTHCRIAGPLCVCVSYESAADVYQSIVSAFPPTAKQLQPTCHRFVLSSLTLQCFSVFLHYCHHRMCGWAMVTGRK